ncbi:MAG: hypothetical protein PVI20_16860 [Desulfobacteraceae bacterium]
MNSKIEERDERLDDYTYLFGHMPTRPIKYVKDQDGDGWLCDESVDTIKDLRKQGCWRCDEMAFPTGGR